MGTADGESSVNEAESDRKTVFNMIDYVESQIKRGMKIGAVMDEVADVLAGAKLMLDAGMTEDAAELTTQASEMAGKSIRQFELLKNGIRKARNKIAQIVERGGNAEEAEEMLKKAEEAMEATEYKSGISYAMKSVDFAEREMGKQDAWRVELNSWKES